MNHESMSGQSHDRSLSQLVEKACRRWEMRRQSAAAQQNPALRAPRAFTIALSREAGTQGPEVAQEVGRLLGWYVYDHELLEHIAKEMGIRTALLESVDEKEQSWLLETVEAFLSAPVKSEWSPLVTESGYVQHLVQTVLALGIHGECVIVGRGAPFILPSETTLRVRLVAPVPERIAALSRKLGISEREAALKVRTVDRERSDFVQDHFFKDANDPRNYDLVLNVSRLSVAQSAELIVETLHRLRTGALEITTMKQSS
jgi:Cytidylate kinase-like family